MDSPSILLMSSRPGQGSSSSSHASPGRHECIICHRKVGRISHCTQNNGSPQINAKILMVLCAQLNVPYGKDTCGNPLPLCHLCTGSAIRILKLQDVQEQIEIMQAKLQILVENVQKRIIFVPRRKKMTGNGARGSNRDTGDARFLGEETACDASYRGPPPSPAKASYSLLQPVVSIERLSNFDWSAEQPVFLEVQIKEEYSDEDIRATNYENESLPADSLDFDSDADVCKTETELQSAISPDIPCSKKVSHKKKKRPCGGDSVQSFQGSTKPKNLVPFFTKIQDGKWMHKEFEIMKADDGYKCCTCLSVTKKLVTMAIHVKGVHYHLENEEPLCKKRKDGLIWNLLTSFKNTEEALEFIKAENLWRIRRKHVTESGEKIYYYCKIADECEAKKYLLFRSDTAGVDMYQTVSSHTHEMAKKTGLDPETKSKVKELFELGITKPKCIMAKVRELKLSEPKMSQLNTYILTLHKSKGHGHVCEECGKMYSKKCDLVEHKKTIHAGLPKVYVHFCPICGKPLRSALSLNNHSWSHLSQEEIDVRISEGKINPLKQIRRTSHPCRFCGKCFGEVYLKLHERKHSSTAERKYMCTKCRKPKSFWTEAQRNQHDRVIHPAEPNKFECNVCLMKFPTWQRLQKHSWTHTGETPYICSTCGKGFRSQSLHNAHQITHQEGNVRPFRCEICSQTYRWAAGLKRHKVTSKSCNAMKVALDCVK